MVQGLHRQAHLKSRPSRAGATRSSSMLEGRMAESLTIGELARRTGVTTSALRYYDELGLVRPIQRVSGHRRYGVDAVAEVGVVRFFQEVGFTLAETQRLVSSRKRPSVAWRELAVRKSEELRRRIASEKA